MTFLSNLRFRGFLELAVGYGLIIWVIWTPTSSQRFMFWVAFAWILTTTFIYRPDAKTLGLRLSGLTSFLWTAGACLLVAALLVLVPPEIHRLHPVQSPGSIRLHMTGYLLWAFEQQFILQDYFLLRLLRILPSPSAAIISAALMFSAAHLPNPVLTVATLAWGFVACSFFLRYRNLYALAMAHGILGLCVAISVPETLTRHMMVGWGYLHYHH